MSALAPFVGADQDDRLPTEIRFAGSDGGNDRLGRIGLVQTGDEIGAVREHGETRENMQVILVIGRADEEEVPRRLAVRRAEEDRTDAPSVGDEALLEEIGVVEARMQERHALADCRRCRVFAVLQFLEEALLVVDLPAANGKVRLAAIGVGQQAWYDLCQFFGKLPNVGGCDFARDASDICELVAMCIRASKLLV